MLRGITPEVRLSTEPVTESKTSPMLACERTPKLTLLEFSRVYYFCISSFHLPMHLTILFFFQGISLYLSAWWLLTKSYKIEITTELKKLHNSSHMSMAWQKLQKMLQEQEQNYLLVTAPKSHKKCCQRNTIQAEKDEVSKMQYLKRLINKLIGYQLHNQMLKFISSFSLWMKKHQDMNVV